MVDFNVPPCVGNEIEYVKQAIESHKICGDGQFTKNVISGWKSVLMHKKYYLRQVEQRH